jgi:endonuclease/exonuclease/phosphatase family metal-dependent hydrolase
MRPPSWKWLLVLAAGLAGHARAQGTPDVSLSVSGLGAPFDSTVLSTGSNLWLPFLSAKSFTLNAATSNGTFTHLTVDITRTTICNTDVLLGQPSGLPDPITGVVTSPHCEEDRGSNTEYSQSNTSSWEVSGSGTLTWSGASSSSGSACPGGEMMESSTTVKATGTLDNGQTVVTKTLTVNYVRILKVMTWNIQYGYNAPYTYSWGLCQNPPGEYRLPAVSDLISSKRVHLALLQEVRRGWWEGPCCDDQPTLLANATNMFSVYGVTNDRNGDSVEESWTCHCPGCHRFVGSLTLSRFPIIISRMSAGTSCCDDTQEPRTMESRIRIGDREVVVYNSHLRDGDTVDAANLRRTESVQALDLIRSQVALPLILGGDLNSNWNADPFLPLRAGMNDSIHRDRSFPFDADHWQVDFVMSNLADAALRYSCMESESQVSDHVPVISWYQVEADPAPQQVRDPATLISKVRVSGSGAQCGNGGTGPLRWFDVTGAGTPNPISQSNPTALREPVDFTARFTAGLPPGSSFALGSDAFNDSASEGSELVTRSFQFFNGLNTQVGQVDLVIGSTDRLLRGDGFPNPDEYTRFTWSGTAVTAQQACSSGGSCCNPISQTQACGNFCGGCRPNGCAGWYNCTCPANQVCYSGTCCTPLTQTDACAGGRCGTVSNGCGGTVTCPSCGSHQYCGSNGYCACSSPYHWCENVCTTANCYTP